MKKYQIIRRSVAFPNMRVRSLGDKEVKLTSYARFQEDGAQTAMRDMICSVSTRDYVEGVDGFLRGYGTGRSSVSRGFIRA